MADDEISRFVARFRDDQYFYQSIKSEIDLFEDILKQNRIEQEWHSRVKTPQSLEEKLRKRRNDCSSVDFMEVVDLVAGRIVLSRFRDWPTVTTLLRKEFDVEKEEQHPTPVEHNAKPGQRFRGYDGLHFRVRIKTADQRKRGIIIEIQIIHRIMWFYHEIDHDLRYKGNNIIPKNLQQLLDIFKGAVNMTAEVYEQFEAVLDDHQSRDERQKPEDQRHYTGTQSTFNKTALADDRIIRILQEIIKNNGSTSEDLCLESLAYKEMRSREWGIFSADSESCQWLLDHDNFINWTRNGDGLLWIQGKAGSGKSTLMRFIYKNIQMRTAEDSHVKLSFFFNRRGADVEKSRLGMFRSLLFQLHKQSLTARKAIQRKFDENSEVGKVEVKWDWEELELQDLFSYLIVQISTSKKITIFIDALDEAGEIVANELATYLSNLYQEIKKVEGKAMICFSSRHFPIIFPRVSKGQIITVEDSNRQGIQVYVRKQLQDKADQGVIAKDDEIDSLEERIVAKASGVFQWVCLVIPLILKDDLLKSLERLPADLGDMYQHIILNILNPEDRTRALNLFRWIYFAARPLSLKELRGAMGMVEDCKPIVNMADEEGMKILVKVWSGGLIETKDHGFGIIVEVCHQTVRDFLLKSGFRVLEESIQASSVNRLKGTFEAAFAGVYHNELAGFCIKYLQTRQVDEILRDLPRPEFVDNSSPAQTIIDQRLPFLQYAVTLCFWHASKAEENGCSQDSLLERLDVKFKKPSRILWLHNTQIQEENTFDIWCKAATIYSPRDFFGAFPSEGSTLLQVASMSNILTVVNSLLKNGVNINEQDKRGQQAIHYAVRGGHIGVLEALLSNSAKINAKANGSGTPLQLAARHGHSHIIKLLLQKGARISFHNDRDTLEFEDRGISKRKNLKGIDIETAVFLLLKDAAEFKTQSLQTAASTGNLKSIRLLLAEGSDVNASPARWYGRTALQAAAEGGHLEVLKMLMSAGADVNAGPAQPYGRTALQAAAKGGHLEVVKMLMSAGADVNAGPAQSYGWTALQAAVGFCHLEVVKMLMLLELISMLALLNRMVGLLCRPLLGFVILK